MAKFEKTVQGNIDQLSQYLDSVVLRSGLSAELVDQSIMKDGNRQTRVYVYDKYYMRSSNRASLTLVLVGDEKTVHVCAIGAGGGSGALLRFDWGAEENFVDAIREALQHH